MLGMKLFETIREELGISAWEMRKVLKRGIASMRTLETKTLNPTLEDILIYHDLWVHKLGRTSSSYIEALRRTVLERAMAKAEAAEDYKEIVVEGDGTQRED